jgi:DnaJ-class molecular chaperone
MDKKQGFTYTTTVDYDVASMYASQKCKHCYGRGVIVTHSSANGTIRKNDPLSQNVTYCNCVHKNAKKYG